MDFKHQLKKWIVELAIGLPVLYLIGTTLLRDAPDLLKLAVYIFGWYGIEWLVKKLLS